MALLDIEGIEKSYPGVRALAGVDLTVEAGEVHALLGENGAGKSTLMKIIAGAVVADAGRLSLNGETVELVSPEAAQAYGIATVYQELSLIPSLSIAENTLLGRWPSTRLGTVDWEELRRRARRALDAIGLDADPSRIVASLGMAERQLVEIAKALAVTKVKVLLLDEPTSALSERESQRLFDIIGDLRGRGVAVVYVSHRLKEILEISDRVTVLRDGERIGTVAAEQIDEDRLAAMMVGRAVEDVSSASRPQTVRERRVVLRARGLARPPRLKPIDLELRSGEIVGVFGLVGAGRTRLARTLFGLEPAAAGSLELHGESRHLSSPVDAIAADIGYLGEDRSVGVLPRMTVSENVTLASLPALGKGPMVDFNKERTLARRYVDELDIRVASIDRLAETLSGGNQQKVVLARWLCSHARILILDDPTRGIDVGAKEEVFRLVRRLADEGVAVLYLTSEINEARELPDRLLVMADGRIVTELDPRSPEEEIVAAAAGGPGG